MSLRRRMLRNRKPFKLERPVDGWAKPGSGTLRFSILVSKLLAEGADVTEFVRDKEVAGSSCPVHGELEDPIVMLMPGGDRVAFCCPDCSAPELKAQWDREGAELEKGKN